MTRIVAKDGVVFAAANVSRSVTVPDLTGLMAEFWLGVDAATSKKNHASGGADLIDYAGHLAPLYSANYLTIRSDNAAGTSRGLDSTLVAPDAVTVVVLQRQPVVVSGNICPIVFASGLTSGSSAGATGISGNSATGGKYAFMNGQGDGSTDQAELAFGTADSDFHFVAGTGLIGQVGKIYVANAGVITTDVGTRTDTARSALSMKLGGFGSLFSQGQVDVAYAAMFNGIKTPAQIADLYASLKAWGGTRGLSVS